MNNTAQAQEWLQAAQAAVIRSSGPMTIGEIRTTVAKEMKVPPAEHFRKEVQAGLNQAVGVYTWPRYGSNAVYCVRPVRTCIDEALMRALHHQPLTVAKAAKAVKKTVPYLSETIALKEIKVLLPQHAASGKIVRLAANRQSVIYLSPAWMKDQLPPEQDSLTSLTLRTIARLQSISGTYVRIDYLRNAGELRALLDQTVIRLADERKVVLARYDGPLPLPEDDKVNYVEDAHGEFFIGVALPSTVEE